MKVRTNVGDPTNPPKKKNNGSLSVEMTHQRGTEKSTYTPATAETGHPEYGKTGSGSKVKIMLDKARERKEDIAYDKEGKPYRAGVTTVDKTPAKIGIKINHTPSIPSRVKSKEELGVSPGPTSGKMKVTSGSTKKRRLPHVDYLEKIHKNKRTESGYGKSF